MAYIVYVYAIDTNQFDMPIYVKLKDSGASFFDPIQGLAIFGEKVFEVEKTKVIETGLRYGALVEVEKPVVEKTSEAEKPAEAEKPKVVKPEPPKDVK